MNTDAATMPIKSDTFTVIQVFWYTVTMFNQKQNTVFSFISSKIFLEFQINQLCIILFIKNDARMSLHSGIVV